jgi:hypothetical protein
LGIVPLTGIDLAAYETLKNMSRQFMPPDTGSGFSGFSFLLNSAGHGICLYGQS